MNEIFELLEKLESGLLSEEEKVQLFEVLAEVNKDYVQTLVDPNIKKMLDRVALRLQEPEK